MSNLKERLLKSGGKRHLVEVEVDGAAVKLEIREVNLLQKQQLAEDSGGKGENGEPKNLERFLTLMVARSVYEPGASERLFADDDAAALRDSGVLDELVAHCRKVFMPDAEELGGKSAAT